MSGKQTRRIPDGANQAYSPPREEGWPRHQKKSRSILVGADGVVNHTETFLVSDHPVCAQFGTGTLSFWRSHPSSQGGDFRSLKQVGQLIHTFYDRRLFLESTKYRRS